jgi:hypothetical protein
MILSAFDDLADKTELRFNVLLSGKNEYKEGSSLTLYNEKIIKNEKIIINTAVSENL